MSEIRANTISDAAGTGPIDLHKQSAAKAWVNFNGTGTVAIRDSVNVSSITDGGVSAYAANYSSAMSDANYSFVIGGGDVSTAMWVAIYSGGNLPTANYIAVRTYNAAVAGVDAAYVNLALLGDLA